MKYDYSDLNPSIVNSAAKFSEMSRQREEELRAIEKSNQEKIKREEMMAAGAEASIAQKELFEKQIEILQRQNELLLDNYTKLKDMYDAQVEANNEAKAELKRSRRNNSVMMVIAIIAMLAAIAGPIVTIWVSK